MSREQPSLLWARGVEGFRKYDAMESRLTRPVSERMLELAQVGAGMRVLDVASGRGEPGLLAAHRVGPRGRVVAVDLVEGYLQIGRERALAEGLTNVDFVTADAEAMDLGQDPFDVATLRWGLMYMGAPERALRCIHRALKPGGTLVVASWCEAERVAYASVPARTLARHVEFPQPLPGAPGVSRHADRDDFAALLWDTGFDLEASEEMEVPVLEALEPADVVAWILALKGPRAGLIAAMPPEARTAWEKDLAEALEPYRAGDRFLLGGTTRLDLAGKRS